MGPKFPNSVIHILHIKSQSLWKWKFSSFSNIWYTDFGGLEKVCSVMLTTPPATLCLKASGCGSGGNLGIFVYRVENSQDWVKGDLTVLPINSNPKRARSYQLSHRVLLLGLWACSSLRLWMPQEQGRGLINQRICRSSLVPGTHWAPSIFLCLSERENKVLEVDTLIISKNISSFFT